MTNAVEYSRQSIYLKYRQISGNVFRACKYCDKHSKQQHKPVNMMYNRQTNVFTCRSHPKKITSETRVKSRLCFLSVCNGFKTLNLGQHSVLRKAPTTLPIFVPQTPVCPPSFLRKSVKCQRLLIAKYTLTTCRSIVM